MSVEVRTVEGMPSECHCVLGEFKGGLNSTNWTLDHNYRPAKQVSDHNMLDELQKRMHQSDSKSEEIKQPCR